MNAGGKLDVVGLGALNVDLIAAGPDAALLDADDDNETVATVEEIWARLVAEDLDPMAFLGGSAFNAVEMLAQLGTELHLGMIGIAAPASAGLAESHADRLEALGIEDVTRWSPRRPGTCLAISNEERRRLYTAPEANLEIADHLRGERPREAVRSARVLHLTSLLEDPAIPGSNHIVASVADFVTLAKADNPGLELSFDPGRTWVDGLPRLPDLRRVYAQADYLFVNPQELALLSVTSAPASLCSPQTIVVVKDLDEVVVQTAAGFRLGQVPRLDSAVAVDVTGAGDALAAGVLAALGEQRSVVEGCRLGLRIAAERVSAVGDRGHFDLRDRLGPVWATGWSVAR